MSRWMIWPLFALSSVPRPLASTATNKRPSGLMKIRAMLHSASNGRHQERRSLTENTRMRASTTE